MTDSDLLELAAKAAGMNGCAAEFRNPDRLVFLPDGIKGEWSPLTDDGDALRLAVKLRLNLNFEEWDGAEYACAVPHKSHQGQDEVMGDDENSAARRAIVRAAATIGGASCHT